MFDQTWRWAGRYRTTDKNIGVAFREIPEKLGILCRDAEYWIAHGTYVPDEIAVRFHHRLVAIHPFPNGNGRHARLIADALVMKLGRPTLTWGSAGLRQPGNARARYLEALRKADDHDYRALFAFARS